MGERSVCNVSGGPAPVSPTRLEQLVRSRGGFTLDHRDGVDVREGWSVCGEPHTTIGFPAAGWDHALVAAWLDRARRLAGAHRRARHLGGWLDPATAWVFLDVVAVFGPDEWPDALAMARRHRQRAVFDLGRRRLVAVDGGVVPVPTVA